MQIRDIWGSRVRILEIVNDPAFGEIIGPNELAWLEARIGMAAGGLLAKATLSPLPPRWVTVSQPQALRAHEAQDRCP